MVSKSDSDSESIVSLEDENSEVETEVKPKSIKKKEKIPEGYVPVEISKKTGKPKRIMSQKQKDALAAARSKGRIVRHEMMLLKKKQKELKKDKLLMTKLEVEAEVLEHKKKLQQMAIRAGYEPTEEQKKNIIGRKPYKKRDHLEDDDYDKSKKDEIAELQKQLKELQKKHKLIPQSESESESEEEEVKTPIKPTIKPKKVIEPEKEERYKPKKPTIKPVEKVPDIKERRKPQNPMMNYEEDNENPAIKAALNSLFA
jgi:hypothetical protein